MAMLVGQIKKRLIIYNNDNWVANSELRAHTTHG